MSRAAGIDRFNAISILGVPLKTVGFIQTIDRIWGR
jgi:hypothetical protein